MGRDPVDPLHGRYQRLRVGNFSASSRKEEFPVPG